jgi:hypothetical protein
MLNLILSNVSVPDLDANLAQRPHTRERRERKQHTHTHRRVAGRGRTDTIASSKRRKVSEDMAAPSNVESDDYYKVRHA